MSNSLRLLFLLTITASIAICRADPVLEDTIEQIYPMEPRANFSIRNTDGSIRIYGADIDEVKVQATKKAYKADRLKQIAVEVTARPGEISIDTKYPPQPKWGFFDRSGTVDYIIILPQSCRVSRLQLTNGEVLVEGMRGQEIHASLVNGRMFGHNCFGKLYFYVTNGGLDVGYDWWETQRFVVDAGIANGNVRAFLPGEAAFHLIAAAPNGHVASDFLDKRERVSGGMKKIDTVIGEAAVSEIQIRSSNGNIQIAEVNF